jgi:fumarate reductase subunit C
MDTQERSKYTLFIIICAAFDILILAFPLITYALSKIVDFYIVLAVWLGACFLLVVFTILYLVYFLLRFKKDSWKSAIPFLLNGVTLFLIIVTPYLHIGTNITFEISKPKYVQIIAQVENGKLKPSISEKYFIKLSPEIGDFILVDQSNSVTSIFFNTTNTSTWNYSGFIYRSNDTSPPSNLFGAYWIECEHYESNWYYCNSLD